jgi:NADP-dependent 3-hydroxy acid dehydrogenase YdfG
MSLAFQRAIVVGASSGIGEAIARRLASEGAAVALVGRREGELLRVADAIAASGRGRAIVAAHDVTRYELTNGLFERLVADLGGLDLFVYAAGVQFNPGEGEYDFAKDRQMLETNALGLIAWGDVVAPHFEAARRGTILGLSSIAGERGRRSFPGYSTSKAAMTAYLEALRNRISRHGVNVVTIKPGFVDTALTKGMPGLLWLIPPERAAELALGIARRGGSPSAFVPWRWRIVAFVVRNLPSFVFRKLNL